MMNSNVRKLRKKIKSSGIDTGTVVRFVASGKYTYAAIWIETVERWYLTTSSGRTPWGGTLIEMDKFMAILRSDGVTKAEVAVEWETLVEEKDPTIEDLIGELF